MEIFLNRSGDIYKVKHVEAERRGVEGEIRMPKFMQTLNDEILNKLSQIAKERGITVQELIRAVIIPEWLNVTHIPSKFLPPKPAPQSPPPGPNSKMKAFIENLPRIPPPERKKKSKQKQKVGISRE